MKFVSVKDSAIAQYWDYEHNTIDPATVASKSGKKFWWICPECHQSHERSAGNEQKSQLCQKCGHKKGTANGQRTHLAKTLTVADVPVQLNQWDYEKNPMPPSEVASKCNKKFWWICSECGESFQRAANHEHETQLCRVCGLKRRTENNLTARLAKSHSIADDPVQSKCWDYNRNTEDPKTIFYRSNGYYWWKCPECGKSYRRTAGNQYASTHVCDDCAIKIRVATHAATRLERSEKVSDKPNLLVQWDYDKNGITPDKVLAHSVTNYWWKCPRCGKSYYNSPDHKYESKVCSDCGKDLQGKMRRKNEIKRKGSFGDQHPHLAKEWHPTLNGDVTPYDITSGCGEYFYWQCKYGHVFHTSPSERVSRHAGCPTCRMSLRTSFTEQAIAFYLSKVVKVDQHFKQGGFNFDIFIEPFKTVVEYDGMFWHAKADTAKRDTRKDKYCKKQGWRIIRVKEAEKINKVDSNHIYAQRRNTDYVWLINQVCNLLGVLPPIDINIERDTPEIYARVNPVGKEGSLVEKKPELLKYWDKEANLPVTPDMVAPFSHLTFSWRCPDCGHEWMQSLIGISKIRIVCPQCREKAFAEKGLKANGQYKKGRKAE